MAKIKFFLFFVRNQQNRLCPFDHNLRSHMGIVYFWYEIKGASKITQQLLRVVLDIFIHWKDQGRRALITKWHLELEQISRICMWLARQLIYVKLTLKQCFMLGYTYLVKRFGESINFLEVSIGEKIRNTKGLLWSVIGYLTFELTDDETNFAQHSASINTGKKTRHESEDIVLS